MDVLANARASGCSLCVPLFVSCRMAWMCWPMRGRLDVVSVVPLFVSHRMAWMCWPMRGRLDVVSVVPLFVSHRMAWMCWPMRGRLDVVSVVPLFVSCRMAGWHAMDAGHARASGCSLCCAIVCFL